MSSKKTKKRTQVSLTTGAHYPLEQLLRAYLDDYVARNKAARILAQGLKVVGTGLRPVIDHITFRTLNVDKRAGEFLKHGYEFDEGLGIIEYENWWAKVYRKPGYPAIFIDQAFDGARGKKSLIPDWVKTFGGLVPCNVIIEISAQQLFKRIMGPGRKGNLGSFLSFLG